MFDLFIELIIHRWWGWNKRQLGRIAVAEFRLM
jgi:hypothetical protein